jgi:putative SOS response-associated peptidase YedK
MCGRFALSANAGEIEKLVPGIDIEPEVLKRYNIAPSQVIYAIINREKLSLSELRWGLIPFWAKEESIGNKMINARCETITEKSSFKNLIKSKRCLIPASGYYEWRKVPGDKIKQPFYIKPKSNSLFSFAGLWDEWKSPAGEIVRTGTIITCPPCKSLEFIHNRMPVIISSNDREVWLNKESNAKDILDLLKAYPESEIDFYEVSRIVNNPSFDIEECIVPVTNNIF